MISSIIAGCLVSHDTVVHQLEIPVLARVVDISSSLRHHIACGIPDHEFVCWDPEVLSLTFLIGDATSEGRDTSAWLGLPARTVNVTHVLLHTSLLLILLHSHV